MAVKPPTERSEPISSRINSVSSQFSDGGPAVSPSARSSISSWSEEPAHHNMDISTGHMILRGAVLLPKCSSGNRAHRGVRFTRLMRRGHARMIIDLSCVDSEVLNFVNRFGTNMADALHHLLLHGCRLHRGVRATTSYMEDHMKNKDRLAKEWEALCAYQAEPNACTVDDHSRIPLKVENSQGNSDYINASPIMDHDPRNPAYIATQGPLPSTVADFWQSVSRGELTPFLNKNRTVTPSDPRGKQRVRRGASPMDLQREHIRVCASLTLWKENLERNYSALRILDLRMVWENGCVVIVMLTPLVESGLKQCYHYWPDEGSNLYHIYEVNLVSEHIWCDDFLVRSFYLKNMQTNETRTVTQFHFLTWLNQNVPETSRTLLDFRRYREHLEKGRKYA
ncbi:hypothetical protein KUCAC02_033868, partial [Chaenocephalus aceratus]